MGSLSNYLENKLLDHLLGTVSYTPAATVYVGYSTADPTEDGSGLAEPTGGGYAREGITFNAASGRTISNQQVIFPKATGSQGTITHFAIFDAATAGNMLAYGALSVSKDIEINNTPVFGAGEIQISIGGQASDYLANTFLNFAFRNQAFAQPSIYVGLDTTATQQSDTGATVSEPSGNGYSRISEASWNAASAGLADNVEDLVFPTATGPWGTIAFAFLADSGTTGAGNLLVYLDITDQSPDNGDVVEFLAGEINITLD